MRATRVLRERGVSIQHMHVSTLKPIFPTPGGGMSLARVPEMCDLYGRDVMFLIGGGLHRHGPELVENSRYFRRIVEQM